MSQNQNEFIKGGIVGCSQTIIGHPLDTLKTLKQNNSKINISFFNKNNLMSKNNLISKNNLMSKNNPISNFQYKSLIHLFKGVKYPLFVSTFYNSQIFGLYNICKKYGFNDFSSGFISGGILSSILTPFELYKIKEQTALQNTHKNNNLNNNLNYNFNNLNSKLKFTNLFIGFKYTFWRESLATGLYFHSYNYCKKSETLGDYPFISGGIAGLTSWLFTYPIDTIKTNYQINPKLNLLKIINEKPLFNGLGFCLLRAFIVNGVSFAIYEKL